jgi:hypothetical protein
MVIMTLVFAQEDYTSDDPEKNPNKKDDPSPLFKELINHETKKLENNFSFKKENTQQTSQGH